MGRRGRIFGSIAALLKSATRYCGRRPLDAGAAEMHPAYAQFIKRKIAGFWALFGFRVRMNHAAHDAVAAATKAVRYWACPIGRQVCLSSLKAQECLKELK